MSDLSYFEKKSLEQLFRMEYGYVLDFSDRTFREFILEKTGIYIDDLKYKKNGTSKANRLRTFWEIEPNHIVSVLLGELILHVIDKGEKPEEKELIEKCQRIVQRLAESAPVPEIEVIQPNTAERDFAILAKSVKDAIEKNEPETGIDRLHTYLMKFLRALCQKHGVAVDKQKPLHSLAGEYLKCLKKKGLIESEMTELIMKSSISILDAYNRVRNNQSLAHDNRLLNYNESLLIYNQITSIIKFIQKIENIGTKIVTQEGDSLF